MNECHSNLLAASIISTVFHVNISHMNYKRLCLLNISMGVTTQRWNSVCCN